MHDRVVLNGHESVGVVPLDDSDHVSREVDNPLGSIAAVEVKLLLRLSTPGCQQRPLIESGTEGP
jgi:hypothetical protein